MAEGPDPAPRLLAQLHDLVGPDLAISCDRERDWASINFSGTRYQYRLRSLRGQQPPPWEQLAARLEAHEFDIPGYFVADMLLGPATDADPPQGQQLDILLIVDPVRDVARTPP